MNVLDYIKMTCRVSTDAFDDELNNLIAAACADMRRVGVREEYINAQDALVVTAIGCFCKSRFGMDNADSEKYFQSYQQMVADMLNSKQNECAGGTDEGASDE